MAPKYEIGQRVLIKKVKDKVSASRGTDIGQYAGSSGSVTNYYWISPNFGKVFYIYTVKMESDHKEIVLHEDEIQAGKPRTAKKA